MELGKLITSMSTTQLETSKLPSRPFYSNGISYLDTQWPDTDSSLGINASKSSSRTFKMQF
jgi:hypothetical protein